MLLQALLGDINLSAGALEVADESIAYCGHNHWLQSYIIRSNIIGCYVMDAEWYLTVVLACGLVQEFGSLQQGDATKLSHNGSSLSASQKIKIGLARAVYSRAPIMIFDDIISGLDKDSAKAIVNALFSREYGLLRALDTTVIFTARQCKLPYIYT
ncbi:hypothetical protein VHEMI03140 [[Torrubiella] hemipterigena]|uniref:ABC transporter domain-containing protein n=1 Tax=[Torrubiella] hemipterigena TaxID=1531966 RepID=A0A0A1SRN5_9HYPO|nr:hypothetical protein VHEMI03140 [[Torrubiella] hemipterigena]